MKTRRSHRIAATFGVFAFAASMLATSAPSVAAETPDHDDHFTFQKVVSPADPTFTQLLGINDHNLIAGYHTNTPGKRARRLAISRMRLDSSTRMSTKKMARSWC